MRRDTVEELQREGGREWGGERDKQKDSGGASRRWGARERRREGEG